MVQEGEAVTKDWNEEWDMEQAEVDSIIASWKEFQECSHEWTPAEKVEGALSWIEFVCIHCGGAQIKSSALCDELEPLLPEQNEGKGQHCR